MKSTVPKATEIQRRWFLLDATGRPAGRLAVEICSLLRGRGKADYAPHVDAGDFVVVVNTARVVLTGRKEATKRYKNYTGFQSGLKETAAGVMREKRPNYILWHAVRGMLPKNHLSRKQLTRLKLYPGPEHPHAAQNPVVQA